MTFLLGLMSPRLWIALILAAVLGLSHYAAYRSGRAAVRAEWTAATLKATEAARQVEANWQTDVQALQEVHQDELTRLASDLAAARAGLRNRAGSRLPAAAQPSCAGASPAALSAPDADVALGLAAEADRLRADYQTCTGWIEAVTKKGTR